MRTVAERLEDLRVDLRSDLERDTLFLSRDVDDRGEDLTPSQHPADVASDLYTREALAADDIALSHELREVEDALHRVAAGTYGRCVDCEGAIAPERLVARPQAARCLACQRHAERRPSR